MRAVPVSERADLNEPALALTFDDGPSEWTAAVLDVLRDQRVRATFFVIGDNIPGREQVLRRIHREGHEVGNHTLRHLNVERSAFDPDDFGRELMLTTSAIEDVIGVAPRVFRPPYFAQDDTVAKIAGECGFEHLILASVWTDDWDEVKPPVIARRIVEQARPGSIIDLHDGRPPHTPPYGSGGSRESRAPTVAAVREIVPRLRAAGFTFLTVSELLAR